VAPAFADDGVSVIDPAAFATTSGMRMTGTSRATSSRRNDPLVLRVGRAVDGGGPDRTERGTVL
jgi:hypothetical protein